MGDILVVLFMNRLGSGFLLVTIRMVDRGETVNGTVRPVKWKTARHWRRES
jgi:hypothetical protein